MDESGDGQLGADELKNGFKWILGKDMDDEKLNEIVAQVDGKVGVVDKQGNRYIDYSDFLIASIDYSEHQFYQYCEKAYELYFNNSLESIDVQELVDIFCQEKLLSHDLIEFYIKKIDADGNGNIEKDEFF
jgi:Ca2+-binding EF-hand superfamily protein